MFGLSHSKKRTIICISAALAILVLCSSLSAFQEIRRGRLRPGGAVPSAPPFAPQPQGSQPQGSEAQNKGSIKMRIEEGKVTADVVDARLQDVLLELAERTGVIFEVRTQDNPLVSIHLQNIALLESIQRIASGSNAMIEYGQGAESERLTLVHIFPRTAQIQQPSLINLGTGVVTKNNNIVETPEQALKVLTTNASIEDKEKGIEILAKTKNDAAIKALMNCISDPAPEIRAAAIEGLAAMGVREAMPSIVKSLKDEHPGVRLSATTAVALLGDSKNLKDLRPLTFDRDASVSGAAEVAIRKLSSSVKK